MMVNYKNFINSTIYISSATSLTLGFIFLKKWFVQNNYNKKTKILNGHSDSYKVYHIDEPLLSEKYNKNEQQLKYDLQATIEQSKTEGNKAIWFKIQENALHLTQIALQLGFKLHHSESNCVVLYIWLKKNQPCNLPNYCTHLIGAAGVIINEKDEILLVQEKTGFRKDKWNVPMGRVDEGEQIFESAIREVKEETCLDTEFFDLLYIREQERDTFGKPDIFFVFLLKLKDPSQKVIIQESELNNYKWLHLRELKQLVNSDKNEVAIPTQSNLLMFLYELYENGFKFYHNKIYNSKFLTCYNKQFNIFEPNLTKYQ